MDIRGLPSLPQLHFTGVRDLTSTTVAGHQGFLPLVAKKQHWARFPETLSRRFPVLGFLSFWLGGWWGRMCQFLRVLRSPTPSSGETKYNNNGACHPQIGWTPETAPAGAIGTWLSLVCDAIRLRRLRIQTTHLLEGS